MLITKIQKYLGVYDFNFSLERLKDMCVDEKMAKTSVSTIESLASIENLDLQAIFRKLRFRPKLIVC